MPVDLLRESALFSSLNDEELQSIARICQTRTYKPGETIFKESKPDNRLFLIADGQVRISRDIPAAGEEALAILERPDCFGEMSVFDRSTRSADAYSNGGCTLVTIARPDLEMLLEFNRELGYLIIPAMVLQLSVRLRSANEQMRSLLAMSMF